MIRRALIHVAGPCNSGKTTLIERLLDSELALMACVRGERIPGLQREHESAPKGHQELRRYRESGASGVALYRFPLPDSLAFYESKVMADYSEAVLIEGNCPLEQVDLSIFVAPAPRPGEALLRRAVRDPRAEHRDATERPPAALESREALAGYFAARLGEPLAGLARGRPELLDELLVTMKLGLAKASRARPAAATRRWALAEPYVGLEPAQLVVVNLRPEDDPLGAEKLCAEIPKLRKDRAIFDQVIRPFGNRVPITAEVANLHDRNDAGLRKCINRVRRALRVVAEG